MLVKKLRFQSIEEWWTALPKMNRQEICLLNDGDTKGMEVFEPNPDFERDWLAHYKPLRTLAEFRRVRQSGWYFIPAAIAGYREDNRWGYVESYDPESDILFRKRDTEAQLQTSEGQRVVLARIDKDWPHEHFRVYDATAIPQGRRLFIEHEAGWWLREQGSSFRVKLGQCASDIWVMRAMGFIQTENPFPSVKGAKLHRFNAAPILDWIFVKEEGLLHGQTDVLNEITAFLYEHPRKPTFRDVKRLVGMAWPHSQTYYFRDQA